MQMNVAINLFYNNGFLSLKRGIISELDSSKGLFTTIETNAPKYLIWNDGSGTTKLINLIELSKISHHVNPHTIRACKVANIFEEIFCEIFIDKTLTVTNLPSSEKPEQTSQNPEQTSQNPQKETPKIDIQSLTVEVIQEPKNYLGKIVGFLETDSKELRTRFLQHAYGIVTAAKSTATNTDGNTANQ
jgi:hypothetical protein